MSQWEEEDAPREEDLGEFVPVGSAAEAGADPREAGARRPGARRAVGTVEETDLALRPRSVGAIADAALLQLREHFLAYALLGVVCWAPVQALHSVAGAFLDFGDRENPSGAAFVAFLVSTYGLALLGVVAQTLALSLVALRVLRDVRGEPPDTRRDLLLVLRRAPALAVVLLLVFILTTFGCCIFFVGMFWVMVKLGLAHYVLLLENASIAEALNRSFSLTAGNFWRVLGVVVVMIVLTSGFSAITGFANEPTVRAALVEATGLSAGAYGALAFVLVTLCVGLYLAVAGVMWVFIYLDCRARRDGLDLALRLEAAGPGRAAPPLRAEAGA